MKATIILFFFMTITGLSACGSVSNHDDSLATAELSAKASISTIASISTMLDEQTEEPKEKKDSNLTCTCYGGPGNYPYACAPIKKTCYGGPGNYPYDCSVCPQ